MSTSLDARGRTRRALLISGAAAVTAWAGRAPALAFRDVSGPDPFTLGVASGDPWATSVVLWTRLAPVPLAADGLGGMPARDVAVRWEVAADEKFTRIVRRGQVNARASAAHAVHVEVGGLAPGREYYYRFTAMGQQSRTGRARTAPAAGQAPAARFGVVSCSRYETGHFTAYAHLAGERPDLVLHLGDYIYEYAGNPSTPVARPFAQGEITTLADYRLRYARYRLDPDLQALHATSPFAVVFDDHEVDNNWAGDVPEDGQTREQFLARRAAAFRAYHEVMPLRQAARPDGSRMRLHRDLAWGDLATLYMLDTRQYRDDQPCGDGNKVDCAEAARPGRTMLGAAQEAWLRERAQASRARWDVLGQQVFFGELVRPLPDGRNAAPMDSWNGYLAARARVLDTFTTRPRNLVVLTGDIHRHYAATLHVGGPEGRPVGGEFVTTSVTSGGDGTDAPASSDPILARNPNIHYTCDRRGYLLADVTPEAWTTHYRVVPWVTRPGAPLETRRTYVMEAGRPGLTLAG
ncbi:alkaline phosphatase D [Luteitalea sp. TBR-22]|uniref:alkaline phosphatase D family protein n=1 Tax=Luteitalea sp. TBR-22 TaxID=2802971 RepID=UPI001AF527CA|nr:alkaline phosphatase D family protein [Luteitalea sp. TBR-22]BCS34278.1 alkaline phosphatase D [Luteitalea sp. TBR-22]